MKTFLSALLVVLVAAIGAAQLDVPFKSFDVAATTTAAVTSWWVEGGTVRISVDDDDQDVQIRWSPDYLKDGDFEDSLADQDSDQMPVSGTWTHGEDVWNDAGALIGPWGMTEAAGGSVELTATELFGDTSLLFDASGGTAVVELGANFNLDTYSGGFTSWTEDVNAGTGTITEGTASPHTAAGSYAILTGGNAHVDFEQVITVVASTRYFITFWWQEGASDDLCDFRIQESTGGTDWLAAAPTAYASTWAAGEADVATTDGDSSAAFEQQIITFVTDAGITAIRVSFSSDVSADVCNIDDIGMALLPDTFIETRSNKNLSTIPGLTTGGYTLAFSHSDGGTDSALQYRIQDASLVSGDTEQYYTGSAWSTTETWLTAVNVGTTSTVLLDLFEARTESLSGHGIILRFRALMGTSEDITLDNISITETALVADMLLGGSTSGNAVIFLDVPHGKGRFGVISAGAIGVNFAGQFFGGE